MGEEKFYTFQKHLEEVYPSLGISRMISGGVNGESKIEALKSMITSPEKNGTHPYCIIITNRDDSDYGTEDPSPLRYVSRRAATNEVARAMLLKHDTGDLLTNVEPKSFSYLVCARIDKLQGDKWVTIEEEAPSWVPVQGKNSLEHILSGISKRIDDDAEQSMQGALRT